MRWVGWKAGGAMLFVIATDNGRVEGNIESAKWWGAKSDIGRERIRMLSRYWMFIICDLSAQEIRDSELETGKYDSRNADSDTLWNIVGLIPHKFTVDLRKVNFKIIRLHSWTFLAFNTRSFQNGLLPFWSASFTIYIFRTFNVLVLGINRYPFQFLCCWWNER